ncbi:hypothetical protein [Streptomyces sp. Ac-502]|uniref:hypothetical protein n=1 Tax=Streptomyces sp. Ac-502 TaxID=3342801 RepID=UPI00386280BD
MRPPQELRRNQRVRQRGPAAQLVRVQRGDEVVQEAWAALGLGEQFGAYDGVDASASQSVEQRGGGLVR